MKKNNWLLLVSFIGFLLIACNNDDDAALDPNEINSFIFRGLNELYLFKNASPDLAEGRFKNDNERDTFINQGGVPDAFFERLTISADRFSRLFEDFEILERFFQGISIDDGLQFNEKIIQETGTRYIVITDVIKGSPADKANIKRGMIFNRVNGSKIDINNRIALFGGNSFSIGEARFEGNTLIDVDNEIALIREEITENPIATTNIITDGSHKIGYLQYNGFVFNFEEDLNNEFAKFKAEGVTDFVLDLRYNGGGRTITANALSGMITGQFGGQVYSMREWNRQIQEQIANEAPEDLIVNFVTTTTDDETPLNSLGLNKLYVITSKEGTASASELVINSLKAYIDVVVIGNPLGTVGKSQASITLYDSPTFRRRDLNPAHKYAMQPLVFRTLNANSEGVPGNGILPDIEGVENDRNLGILGNPDEPLLKLAIDDITGRNTPSAKKTGSQGSIYIGNQSMYNPIFQRMYDDF